jgi:heterodisulfide reductase subunit C
MDVQTLDHATKTLSPESALRKKLEDLSGEKISACFQCQKCTSGCPVTFAMDLPPHLVIRLLHLGQLQRVLDANTYWVCAACETCSTRCPNSIDIAHVMDTLRQYKGEGSHPIPTSDRVFHQEFLNSVKRYGRVHEMSMVTLFTLRTKGLAGLIKQGMLGLSMMLKGKLGLIPEKTKGRDQVRTIFQRTAKERSK